MFASVLLPLLAVYGLTAQWSHPYHIDALTNAITGWYIGNEQTVVAHRHQPFIEEGQHGNAAWFEESPEGEPVSQYPPGAALVAGLVYAVTPGDMEVVTYQGSNRPDLAPIEVPMPPLWPATLSAVVVTATACAVLGLAFLGLSGSPRAAVAAGLVAGLATGAWAVAARMSWTHGPAMLAVALAVLALQRQRWGWAGAALGFAVLCRPHLAVIAAAAGIGLAVTHRSFAPLVRIGLASGCGFALLLAYNAAVWGGAVGLRRLRRQLQRPLRTVGAGVVREERLGRAVRRAARAPHLGAVPRGAGGRRSRGSAPGPGLVGARSARWPRLPARPAPGEPLLGR